MGRRESRPEIAAYRAKQEVAPKPEASEEAVLSEWKQRVQELEDMGAFDSEGRWTSIPDGWTREQVRFAEQLRGQMKSEVAEQPAEPTNEASNVERLEKDNFEPGPELGKDYAVTVDGADEILSYQGDDAEGKAMMVTSKGMRLLKSRGLEEVKSMAEIYPNEFYRAVPKSELKEVAQAA